MLSRHGIVFAVAVVGLILAAVFDWLAGIGFICSLLLVGAAIPLVLCFAVQLVVCWRKQIPFQFAFSSPDVLIILLVPPTWSYALTRGCPKSLSNLEEVPIIGAAWGICIIIRTFFVVRSHPRAIWLGSWVTVILTTVITALMGVLFPGFPE